MNKIIAIFCIIFLTAFRQTTFCSENTYLVTKVYDGDTILVQGFDKPIRILGIDAFESSHNYKVTKQARRIGKTRKEIVNLGRIAKTKAKEILTNKCVELDSDYLDKGKYGRYLRYVYIDKLDYQKFMLEEGLALPYCSDKKILMYEYYNSLSKYKCED